MWSKNKARMTPAERAHVEAVKMLQCSVCDAQAPSDAHEIRQGLWFASVALCRDCHQGSINGLHGQRRMWLVMKMDELAALNVTLQRLHEQGSRAA